MFLSQNFHRFIRNQKQRPSLFHNNDKRNWKSNALTLMPHIYMYNVRISVQQCKNTTTEDSDRQPGVNLPQCPWSLINYFWTDQGHCASCHEKYGHATNVHVINVHTMLHTGSSWPQIKLNGGLQWHYSADNVAVQWLMAHGLWEQTMTITTITMID